MSYMILKLFGSPKFFMRTRIATAQFPIDNGRSPSRDSSAHHFPAVSKLADVMKLGRRHWLRLSPGPEIDISRARFTPVEDMMLNLP
jgi:hypothetical protein